MKENQNYYLHSAGAHTAVIAAAIAALLTAASCAGIPTALKKPFEPASLTIIVTGNTSGALEPRGCGCRSQGGLARRASLAHEHRSKSGSVLLLDAGNLLPPEDFPYGTRDSSARCVFDALALMGTDAVNVSLRDSGPAAEYLKAAGSDPGLACISANVRQKETNQSLFEPWVIKRTGSLKIGIFGIAAAGEAGASRAGPVTAAPPPEAAETAAGRLKDKGCSIIIALSQLPPQKNAALARQVAGIDFILGSAGPARDKAPRLISGTVLASPGSGGNYAAVLRLHVIDPEAPFADHTAREALQKKIGELRRLEQRPPDEVRREDLAAQRAALEEKMTALSAKNTVRYSCTALDKSIPEDPRIRLLIEQYKTEQTKQALSRSNRRYVEQIPGISMSALSPYQRLKALRIMNHETCRDGLSIASGAGSDPRCRSLGQTVVQGVAQGSSDGQIRYDLLYQKQRYRR